MSLRIYILQQNYECGEVNGHKHYPVCLAQHHELEMMVLHVANNMEEISLQSANGSLLYTLWLFNSWECHQQGNVKQSAHSSSLLEECIDSLFLIFRLLLWNSIDWSHQNQHPGKIYGVRASWIHLCEIGNKKQNKTKKRQLKSRCLFVLPSWLLSW